MKTRYDSVIGLERRALDEKAREIRSVADHIETIEGRIVSIDQSLRAEAAFAVTAIHLPGHAYAARMRNNRSALQEDRRKADMVLSALRDQAAEACGRVTAIEELAEQDRHNQRLALQRSEQSVADDLAAAALLRRLRRANEGSE